MMTSARQDLQYEVIDWLRLVNNLGGGVEGHLSPGVTRDVLSVSSLVHTAYLPALSIVDSNNCSCINVASADFRSSKYQGSSVRELRILVTGIPSRQRTRGSCVKG